MTRNEMKKKIKAYKSAIEVLEELQNECLGYINNTENELHFRESEGDKWNTLSDSIHMLENKIHYTEVHWDDDKMTFSERCEMELVYNNID